MDAYDEGSSARHGPDASSRPAPPAQRGAPADSAEPDVPPGPPEPVAPLAPAEPVAPLAPAEPVAPLASPEPYPSGEPRTGIAALSPRYQVGVVLALAVVAIGVCVHIGMTFLHVAPANTVTRAHGKAVDDWIYPEFEQNWKLFAPNPLQQNISIQVRAGVRGPDGMTLTTGWYDLSAEDGRAIDGNLLPSHTQQNELRRAWDFFVATHDSENRPVGLRGSLSESYLRRIMVLRLGRDDAVRAATGSSGVIERVQVRSRTSNVPPPEWSREKVSMTPSYRELPWWRVPQDEARGGVR
ncbi:DUF5819 family protein [Streptomyces luteogriseus]|uniref:DUF5819 family protein n=1 Tax=Streptomyces luteogriseus TaxID=68233 RepID=UPI002E2F5C4C|nr:DUF5819 family protein [Streptomyces luteogriseus]WTJ33242.1 DUF5819 family protein [Streptomyces luteogriseus]